MYCRNRHPKVTEISPLYTRNRYVTTFMLWISATVFQSLSLAGFKSSQTPDTYSVSWPLTSRVHLCGISDRINTQKIVFTEFQRFVLCSFFRTGLFSVCFNSLSIRRDSLSIRLGVFSTVCLSRLFPRWYPRRVFSVLLLWGRDDLPVLWPRFPGVALINYWRLLGIRLPLHSIWSWRFSLR